MSDRGEFTTRDWLRYVSQSQAILNKLELRTRMQQTPGLQSWEWLSEIMSLRLMPEFGHLFSHLKMDLGNEVMRWGIVFKIDFL